MSVRAIEAEVSIKSGVSAECTIGREVIVEVHDDINLESLEVTANGLYEPTEGIDGYNTVVVAVPPTIPDISPLTVTDDGTYTASGDGYNPVTVNTGVASLRQEIASAETASGCSPLIDGLTALTTYANEVTGAQDETLSDAVETLASKYGKAEFNPFAKLKTMQNMFYAADLPENLVIDFEGNEISNAQSSQYGMNNAFRNTTSLKHLTFKNVIANCSLIQLIMYSSVETVTFDNCTIRPTHVGNFADSARQLEAIYGEFDMSNCAGAGVFFKNCPKLHTVRFKPNTIGVSLTNEFCFNPAAFTTDTWVSIANGLRADAPNGIRLNNKNIPIVSAILGNNVDGTFIADPNGSMTLMDFITTIKGWTVT